MLRRAGAGDADLLIATTGLDEVNIVACSIAGHMGARDTTCFVGRRDLLHTAAGADSLLQHFGIGHVVWPEAQLADANFALQYRALLGRPGALLGDEEFRTYAGIVFAGAVVLLVLMFIGGCVGSAAGGRRCCGTC